MPELDHGRSRWKAGCRCEVCHAGLLEYSRMRRAVQAVKAGRAPELRVPARNSRRRLTILRNAGLSIRAISELSGVSIGALQHLQQRNRRHVTITTEQRLLAAVRQ